MYGESYVGIGLGPTLLLEGGRRAQGGVEGDVMGPTVGGSRQDVTSAFAVGACAGPFAALSSGETVDRGTETAGLEGLTSLDRVATLPPMCFQRLLGRLTGGLRSSEILSF
ncbi:MAG: hypothetical protein WBR18_07835 [Anaerolineales bacterium]